MAKGLKFIPKPHHPSRENIDESLKHFSRRIKITHFFSNPDSCATPFQEKSTWNPPERRLNRKLLRKIDHLLADIRQVELKQHKQNMSKDDYRALKSLKKRKNIIIKPADKGSSTVIMNKSDYIFEANRQLSNVNHYRKINRPIHPNISGKINNILSALNENSTINKRQYEYLSVKDNPRSRLFYLTPKIHKDRQNWLNHNKIPPGRPIVSDCNSDTYNLSEYIDSFLQPLATKHPSYVKDTPHFLERINTLRPPEQSFLVTIDVESLYTNINNTDGLRTVKSAFLKYPDPERRDKQIYDLLELCLKNNDFTFNDEWFLQISGTAMGKKFAPSYANIFLANWEQDALKKCPKKPSCYLRYLDDIFIIWPHSENDFNTFLQILNSHHESINLKATIHKKEINFLDLTIFKGHNFSQEGILDTKVYFKPTDSRQLLHRNSYHPKHTFKGIIKSQILRYYRNCNNTTDFNQACTSLFQSLSKRGYPKRFLRSIKNETLLSFKTNTKSRKCQIARCKTCPHLTETDHIIDSKGNIVPLRYSLDCRSKEVVYVIRCKNCNKMYVGETSCELHHRITQHRSDIKTKKTRPVPLHFNTICPGIDNFSVVPVEKVPLQGDQDQEFPGMLSNKQIISLIIREQYWIAKLKTQMPHGINFRHELPPPIPFVIKYCDQANKISTIVKSFFSELREEFMGDFRLYNLVIAYSRNKNLKDHLIHAKL